MPSVIVPKKHPVDESPQLAVGAEQEFKHGVEKRCKDKFDNLHEVEAKHQDAVNIMNFKLEEVERKLRADFSCQSQATDSRIARLRTEVPSSAEKGGKFASDGPWSPSGSRADEMNRGSDAFVYRRRRNSCRTLKTAAHCSVSKKHGQHVGTQAKWTLMHWTQRRLDGKNEEDDHSDYTYERPC